MNTKKTKTIPVVFAKWESRRERPKMASRPFQFLSGNAPKSERERPNTLRDGHLVYPFSGAAGKAGCKPVHFSLDSCPLSCYFSGSVATFRDTLSTSRSVGRGTGAFIYLPPFSENRPIFCSFPFAKIQPVFLPEQTGRKKHRTPFPPSATPAGITHYTLQAKSCAKGQAPLETPDNKTGGMLPSPGAYRRLLSAARFAVCFRLL